MAAPTRGMLGGRLDDAAAAAAAGAAEKRRDEEASDGRSLEDWPLHRVAARSKFMVININGVCGEFWRA